MTAAHHGKAFHGGEHYENFPVGSWLIPASIRGAVLALYRFARTGDDLADEGGAGRDTRTRALHALLDGLHQRTSDADIALWDIGDKLRAELDRHDVPIQPAYDLIQAFLWDADHQPPRTEEAVLAYCSCSANPVGRMVLGLCGIVNQQFEPREVTQASDAVCTGLQLANFAQDMGQDVRRGRIYIPATWLDESGIRDISDISPDMQAMLAKRMAQWALSKLDEGAVLTRMIKSSGVPYRYRLALEVALTIEGGREISRQVLRDPVSVWKASPSISKARLAMVVLRSLRTLLPI